MRNLTIAMLSIAALSMPGQTLLASDSGAQTPRCSFATLSEADQRRYQSRYNRRVRTDGQAHAEAWLQDKACPTDEQQAARAQRRQPVGQDGKPCQRTRLEMRATPGFDGQMTMSPVPVCAP